MRDSMNSMHNRNVLTHATKNVTILRNEMVLKDSRYDLSRGDGQHISFHIQLASPVLQHANGDI